MTQRLLRGSRPSGARAAEGERVAIVKLPDLPLQLLLQDRPEFRGRPTAVVAGEGPEARVTYLNRSALAAGLRLGLTHAAARDRLPGLHTGVVPQERVTALEAELGSGLQMLTPKVEPCAHFPSTFYLDPNGMERLYGGLPAWARAVHAFLKGRGLFGATWVGFHRYRLYAAVGTQLTCRVLESPAEEQLLANGADLRSLGLSAELCDDLAMLEVHGLGDLLALPAAEFGGRFGVAAARVRSLFADDTQLPLQPLGFEEPTEARFDVTPPDADTHRLLFGIKAALHPLLMGLRERGEHIRALHLRFELDAPQQAPVREARETLEPAAPTGDLMTLVELIRLRLAQLTLPHPVEAVTLRADTERAHPEALVLPGVPGLRAKRDSQAAARALARVRAAYGPRSVVRARVREAHLPEARFVWVPTLEPPAAALPYVSSLAHSSLRELTPSYPEVTPGLFDELPLRGVGAVHARGTNGHDGTNDPNGTNGHDGDPGVGPDDAGHEDYFRYGDHGALGLLDLGAHDHGDLDADDHSDYGEPDETPGRLPEADALARVLVRRVLRRPLPLRTRQAAGVSPSRPSFSGPFRSGAPATASASGASADPASAAKALAHGLPEGPKGEHVQRLYGPYRVSGGWWKRTVERDYYYAETDAGGLLWVYWDRPRGAWFLHGTVD